MDWVEIGARVAEARETARLTQTELATELGWDRTRLNKVESGTQRLTALDLVAVARALGRRMDWFVAPRPEAIPSYRGRDTPDWEPSPLGAQLEALASNVAAMHRFNGLRGIGARPTGLSIGTLSEAEQLAVQAGALCGVGVGPVDGIAGVAARVGLLVFALPGDALAEDGAYLPLEHYGVALVNSDRKPGRRRLAAAHELGHHMAGDGLRTDRDLDAADNAHEKAIDRFARAFLLPREAVITDWVSAFNQHGERAAAVRIGSVYQVDMTTLATRLHHDLGLIDSAAAARVRTTITKRGDMIEHGLHNPDDLAGYSLPTVYQQAVIAAYHAEHINPDRAVDLLYHTIDADELPPLRPVPEGRAWEYVS